MATLAKSKSTPRAIPEISISGFCESTKSVSEEVIRLDTGPSIEYSFPSLLGLWPVTAIFMMLKNNNKGEQGTITHPTYLHLMQRGRN
jgi:hypothetical protein